MRSRIRLSAACALALAGVVGRGPPTAGNSLKPNSSTKAVLAARDRPSERGVVQSVSASGLVLRALDGSTVTVTVDARTRVLVDGRSASILDILPGFVAVVTLRGASGQRALEIQAFTTSAGPSLPLAGVVRSVSPSELVLTALDGTTARVPIDTATRVLIDGKPASILDVRPGFVAVIRPEAAGKEKGKRTSERRTLFAFAPARERGAHLYAGIVASVSVQAIVLRARSGGTFRVALAAETLVFLNGTPASIREVEAGEVAVVRTGSRREVWAFGAP